VPAQITVWELLTTSPTHQDALMKVLRDTHVPKGTTPAEVAKIVGNLVAPRVITFADDELPPQGRDHEKALNISVVVKGFRVPWVLI
ncbi:hypothetical protein DVA81_18975, partial [Acinetobacter baumannii]